MQKKVGQVKRYELLLMNGERAVSTGRGTLGTLESFIKTVDLKVSNYLKALSSKVKSMSSASPASERDRAILSVSLAVEARG